MILLDVNLLLYAAFESFPQHMETKRWLEGCLERGDRVGLPWAVLMAFVRIGCNPRMFPQACSAAELWEQLGKWRKIPYVWIPEPTARHFDVVGELFQMTMVTPATVPDVHLAALAMEHGLTLCSNDNGFLKFSQVLRFLNPLEMKGKKLRSIRRKGKQEKG